MEDKSVHSEEASSEAESGGVERKEAQKAKGRDSVASLKKALGDEKAKAEDYLANWQRTQADFINYKRRTEQERGEVVKLANATLVLNLLPIPILDEEMAFFTGVADKDIYTQIVDYGHDYTNRVDRNYGEVSYAQLRSGEIEVAGKKVPTAPLSSRVKALEIAEMLKKWILDKQFELGEPVTHFPSADYSIEIKE